MIKLMPHVIIPCTFCCAGINGSHTSHAVWSNAARTHHACDEHRGLLPRADMFWKTRATHHPMLVAID